MEPGRTGIFQAMTQRHAVNSSFVNEVHYDPENRTATVHLKAGSYRFSDVPELDVKNLVGAGSVGTHFNKIFKAKHGGKATRI